ncbi:uncharacterized protein LOC111639262 [Centruroides sculpturatus]|uniref:uncharacterized protein LOC111639262 n=1 Tax=Centruroides sculpturatus TaxID=218467 RepID=UPI000C6E9B7B|nr:uncharacterized protein LOC111639262 [Centruroides sculpturatus]
MDLKKLYCDESSADVIIVIRTSTCKRIYTAHSIVLCNCSSVFKQLMKEKKKEIEISDARPSTVAQLLRFIYLGKVTIRDWEQALDLLNQADKFHLVELIDKCRLFLKKNINVNNVLYIFNSIWRLGQKDLETCCLDIISFYAMILIYSEDFVNIDINSIITIASQDKLNIRSEIDLFWAVWRWGKELCAKEGITCKEKEIINQIRPILSHIRFNQMSEMDKIDLPKFLSDMVDEYTDIHKSRITKTNNPNKSSLNRFGLTVNLATCFNYCKSSVLGEENSLISFTTDKTGFILGFKLIICGEDFTNSEFRLLLVSTKSRRLLMDENCNPESEEVEDLGDSIKSVKMVIALKKLAYLNANEPYEIILKNGSEKNWLPIAQNVHKSINVDGCVEFSILSNIIGISIMYFAEVDDSRLVFSFHSSKKL